MKNKKIITTLFFIALTTLTSAQQADLIIKNGKIIDGTGNSWYYGDVAISNGKIIYTGKAKNISASKTVGYSLQQSQTSDGVLSNKARLS